MKVKGLTYIEVIENALANPDKIWMHNCNVEFWYSSDKIYVKLYKKKMMWQLIYNGELETIVYLHFDEFSEEKYDDFFVDGWEEFIEKGS